MITWLCLAIRVGCVTSYLSARDEEQTVIIFLNLFDPHTCNLHGDLRPLPGGDGTRCIDRWMIELCGGGGGYDDADHFHMN